MLNLSVTVDLQNGSVSTKRSVTSVLPQAGDGGKVSTVSVATGGTTHDFGDATRGYVFIRNLDDTNFVYWGAASASGRIGKIEAGEFAMFRRCNQNYVFTADTAACLLEITAFDA